MLAVDTNVIVRLLANDDPEQVRRAVALFEQQRILIVKTVLLEVTWVLSVCYRLPHDTIVVALRKLLGLKNVTVEDPAAVDTALAGYERGMDFADALHLASSCRAERFATFDRLLAKRARELPAIEVVVI